MGQKVAGTCYVKVDGQQLVITGGCEAPLTDVKRETIAKGHFKEEDLPPFLKVDALKTKGIDWQKLGKATDMTITCEFRDGSVYVLAGAYVVDEMNVSGDDGKVALHFNGSSGEWQ